MFQVRHKRRIKFESSLFSSICIKYSGSHIWQKRRNLFKCDFRQFCMILPSPIHRNLTFLFVLSNPYLFVHFLLIDEISLLRWWWKLDFTSAFIGAQMMAILLSRSYSYSNQKLCDNISDYNVTLACAKCEHIFPADTCQFTHTFLGVLFFASLLVYMQRFRRQRRRERKLRPGWKSIFRKNYFINLIVNGWMIFRGTDIIFFASEVIACARGAKRDMYEESGDLSHFSYFTVQMISNIAFVNRNDSNECL